ncbi:MAG: hypothetical protein H6633_06730 [Anaerolineales bacterium]|nr:hypothetical protein [Anaerolineales bacterium]
MENNDLRDQLEGLFSDLNDIPASKVGDPARPHRPRAKSRQGEEVLFNTGYTAAKIIGREGSVEPDSLPAVTAPVGYPARSRPVIRWHVLSGAVVGHPGHHRPGHFGPALWTAWGNLNRPETPALAAMPLSPTPTVTASPPPTQPVVTPAPRCLSANQPLRPPLYRGPA